MNSAPSPLRTKARQVNSAPVDDRTGETSSQERHAIGSLAPAGPLAAIAASFATRCASGRRAPAISRCSIQSSPSLMSWW